MKIYKGQQFLCVEDVIMEDEDESIAYIKGNVYHSEIDGCITDMQGDTEHEWNSPETEKYFKMVLNPANTQTNVLRALAKIDELKKELDKLKKLLE